MYQGAVLDKPDFIERFKYEQTLLTMDAASMATFDTFLDAIGNLRSEFIKNLRKLGIPGHIRAQINDEMQRYTMRSHRDWLFAIDPTCKLCDMPIATREEATIDHIVPTSLGGKNEVSNKQIAHGPCNVLKSNRNIKKLPKTMLVRAMAT